MLFQHAAFHLGPRKQDHADMIAVLKHSQLFQAAREQELGTCSLGIKENRWIVWDSLFLAQFVLLWEMDRLRSKNSLHSSDTLKPFNFFRDSLLEWRFTVGMQKGVCKVYEIGQCDFVLCTMRICFRFHAFGSREPISGKRISRLASRKLQSSMVKTTWFNAICSATEL